MDQDIEEGQSTGTKTSRDISCWGPLQLAFKDRKIEWQYYFRNKYS